MTEQAKKREYKLDESKFREYSGGDEQFEMCQNAALIAARNENARLLPVIEQLQSANQRLREALETAIKDVDDIATSLFADHGIIITGVSKTALAMREALKLEGSGK